MTRPCLLAAALALAAAASPACAAPAATVARPAASAAAESSLAVRAPHADSVRVRAAIDTANAAIVAALKAMDGRAYAAVYAPDAVKLVHGGRVVRGREAIARFIAPQLELLRLQEGLIRTQSLWIVGDEAYETGRFTFVFHPRGKESVRTDQGHYVNVWRRGRDGVWRIHRDARVYLE